MKNAGFTLVEVLVALVVGGLLLASLTSVVAGLAKDLKKIEVADSLAQLEAVAPTLRGLIESAVSTDETNPIEPDEFALTVPPPQALGPVGPLKMHLTVHRSGKQQGLFVAFNSVDGKADLPAVVRERQLLVDGFSRIRIDAEPAVAGATSRLPRLLRISFANRGEEPVVLVFRPRISASGTCRFDPISMTCRT